MTITGAMLIAGEEVFGSEGELRATNPATGEAMQPAFGGGTKADVDLACSLAARDFDAYRAISLERRALFLEAIAQNLMDLGDVLIERAMAESGLTRPRLEGERGRTCGQLRLFATLVRERRWQNVTIDTALPERKPAPRPDLRSRRVPLGPVAVFGASNFPLAFSVAGGDTASALAAGCPVVAKAHPSHLGTSELAARAIQAAVVSCAMPEGTFSLVLGEGNAIGEALVRHPAIQAVAFTGSRRGGTALVAIAAERHQPIPVFAEMSSSNPVFLLPSALASRGPAIATGLADSANLGVGQFCTKPGIVLGIDSPELTAFVSVAAAAFDAANAGTLLNEGIGKAYRHGTAALTKSSFVQHIASGRPATEAACSAQPMLFATTAEAFRAEPALADEVFGPTSLLVRCGDEDEMIALAEHLEGQLTATLQCDLSDLPLAHRLLPILERKAGRILVNGFPTGVEVAYAMVHGGPSPSTSDSRVTSVGAMAIDRFLRPVCYQNFPVDLLPEELRDGLAGSSWRLVDGAMQQEEPLR